jgi:hypothetical protein
LDGGGGSTASAAADAGFVTVFLLLPPPACQGTYMDHRLLIYGIFKIFCWQTNEFSEEETCVQSSSSIMRSLTEPQRVQRVV